ncbi:MAG: hypothetical protein K0R62_8385 [Nonomuraea muscovyensis]|jgi:hypothetical protein|nr:hypothetical protein [Nonomuraea muscovyensis]
MTGEWVGIVLTAFAVGASLQLFAVIIRRGRNS